ncbi:uncharacterized protein LOC124455711 [Xenia sp. Carnegie-2017]|uniref:uncharacterized protein LOC124455711 n=1 Tax=Xenia sp. Carnegie-2017 TaxID=2897299 RepID=UPI001F040309|nr:uncharacterized protein LOC124455711 [Xenia sp. Carnegie-2017]
MVKRISSSFFIAVFITWNASQLLINAYYWTKRSEGIPGRGLSNSYVFNSSTVQDVQECFMKCFKHCLCMSFQMCNANKCQLLSINQHITPLDNTMTHCTYYGISVIISKQVNESIPPPPPCQLFCIVNPCQNGGRRVSFIPTTKTSPRFKCECAPGYVGNLCQNIARSCRDYAKGTRKPGMYKIYNKQWPIYVFCDFDNDTSMAWTLIQSYSYQHNSVFKKLPFSTDNRFNMHHFKWTEYRHSKALMTSIKEESTKFRMTCDYDKDGVVYRDYLQASTKQIDIFHSISGQCKFVDFVDVRGQNCRKCTVKFWQVDNVAFHADSYHKSCDFVATGGLPCDNNIGEDSFGYYKCVNSNHRCTSSSTSTSQAWLGGE